MNEQDFERIAQMFAQFEARLDARFEQIEARFEQIEARFERLEARLKNVEARLTNVEGFKSEIISEFNHSLDIKYEELFHRIGLLRDGVADVVERVEGVNQRFDVLNATVEGNALQLLAHHLDPQAHNRRSGDRVKEDEAVFGDVDPYQNFEPEFRRRLVEAREGLDAAADEVRAYCAEKGVELPTANTEAMLRLIEESRKHSVEQRQS